MFVLVDYSEIAFELSKLPFPSRREGKAIHVRGGKDDFFVMAPIHFCRFHSDIAARFLELRKISVRKFSERTEPMHPDWRISGGCFFEMDDESRRLKIWGESDAYGGVDLDWLRAQLESTDDLSSVSIDVGLK